MADKSEGVPQTAMNVPATGQFPFRLNEPFALFAVPGRLVEGLQASKERLRRGRRLWIL
jgi:hypothetical protein